MRRRLIARDFSPTLPLRVVGRPVVVGHPFVVGRRLRVVGRGGRPPRIACIGFAAWPHPPGTRRTRLGNVRLGPCHLVALVGHAGSYRRRDVNPSIMRTGSTTTPPGTIPDSSATL